MIRQTNIVGNEPAVAGGAAKNALLRRAASRCGSAPPPGRNCLFLRDLGDTEVGGFGIAAADDLLYVEDVQLVRQVCTGASVAFDDQAVADFFDRQVDLGRKPEQFGGSWSTPIPATLPEPSMTDEETFARVFGRTDWAVMFILARGGQSYARLRFHVGPGGDVDLPVAVDYSRPFAASDHAAWQEEYLANVQVAEHAAVRLARARACCHGAAATFDPLGRRLVLGSGTDRSGRRTGLCSKTKETAHA